MFKQLYFKYLQSLLIFSIVIAAVYIVLRFVAGNIVSQYLPLLIVAFLLITAISHYVVTKTDVERIENKPDPNLSKEEQMKKITAIERRFISNYMLITAVKLLSFLILLALYAYFNKEDAIRFCLNFMALYVLYSIFEIIYIKKPVTGKK
jgi:hypothetical protein